jgi:hypothetical protein
VGEVAFARRADHNAAPYLTWVFLCLYSVQARELLFRVISFCGDAGRCTGTDSGIECCSGCASWAGVESGSGAVSGFEFGSGTGSGSCTAGESGEAWMFSVSGGVTGFVRLLSEVEASWVVLTAWL